MKMKAKLIKILK